MAVYSLFSNKNNKIKTTKISFKKVRVGKIFKSSSAKPIKIKIGKIKV